MLRTGLIVEMSLEQASEDREEVSRDGHLEKLVETEEKMFLTQAQQSVSLEYLNYVTHSKVTEMSAAVGEVI